MNTTEVIHTLFEKGIVDRRGVVKSMMALKLDPADLQETFGFTSYSEFVAFFTEDPTYVQPAPPVSDVTYDALDSLLDDIEESSDPELEQTPVSVMWTVEHARITADEYFNKQNSSTNIAEMLGRTPGSVLGFLRRTWTLGQRVPKDLYDLIFEDARSNRDAYIAEQSDEDEVVLEDGWDSTKWSSPLSELVSRSGYPLQRVEFVKMLVGLQDYCWYTSIQYPKIELVLS